MCIKFHLELLHPFKYSTYRERKNFKFSFKGMNDHTIVDQIAS
jgi:hypothetical protein